MSQIQLNDDSGKKFQLTEILLRRFLTSDEYESLKCIEPAIVVTNKRDAKQVQNPGYKHLAVSASKFYVLNSPANKDSDLQLNILFKNVIGIDLVFDRADFLQGDLTENSLHVKITCKYGINSGLESDDGIFNKSHISIGEPAQNTSNSLFMLKDVNKTSFLKNSLLANSPSLQNVSRQSHRSLPKPINGTEFLNASYTNMLHSANHKQSLDFDKDSKMSKASAHRKIIKHENTTHSSLSRSWNDVCRTEFSQNMADCQSTTPPSSNSSLSGSLGRSVSSKLFSFLRGKTESEDLNGNTAQNKSSSVGDFTREQVERTADMCQKEYHVDIFTIDKNSKMFNVLTETWVAAIIKTTLAKQSEHHLNMSGGVLNKFSELKEDILASQEVSELFWFTKELKFACESFVYIKKAFWKTHSLLKFYLKKMESLMRSSCTDYATRMDEVDLLILIGELIASLFLASEMFSSRNSFLDENSNVFVKGLMGCAVNSLYFMNKEFTTEEKNELEDLIVAWSNTQVSILSGIINAANQFTWCYCGQSFNVSLLVDIMKDKRMEFIKVLDHIIIQTTKYLSAKKEWSPEQLVQIYFHLHVLNFVCVNVPAFQDYLTTFFHEEIRYYICKTSGEEKLLSHWPMTPLLSRLLKQVMSLLS